MQSFVGIGLVGLVLLGCVTEQPSAPSTGVEVPIVRLRTEPYSFSFFTGIREPARLVIRDIGTWRSVWNRLYDRSSPVPALPDIDFSKETVVVAALGERGSSGYIIVFEGAFENDAGGVDVIVRFLSPARNCMTPAVLTQPVDIARIPVKYASVRFVERKGTAMCNT